MITRRVTTGEAMTVIEVEDRGVGGGRIVSRGTSEILIPD